MTQRELEDDLRTVRRLMFRGAGLEAMMLATGQPRAVVIELYWACKRHPKDGDAHRHAVEVLRAQESGLPLVNGRFTRDRPST